MLAAGFGGALGAAWHRAVTAATPLLRASYRATRRVVTRALEPELGQSMVEYAIVLALVALAAMVAVQALGTGVSTVFSNILAKVQGLGR